LYSPPNIIKVIEVRVMEWAGHVVRKAQVEHAPMTLIHKSGKGCCSDSRNTIFNTLISAKRTGTAIRRGARRVIGSHKTDGDPLETTES
jgi:hypothetical protein